MQYSQETPVLGSLFNKVAGLTVCNFHKKWTPTQVIHMDAAKFLRIVFLYNTSGGCFWQSYHNTIKSAGVPVLWFRASTCFRFWSKTFMKHCSNNSLLSCDKAISFLLDLIGHVLLISKYILKKHDFDEKLRQCYTQVAI